MMNQGIVLGDDVRLVAVCGPLFLEMRHIVATILFFQRSGTL